MGLNWQRHSAHIIKSKRWKALRLEALRRDGWKCVACGARHGLEVDHVQPVRTHPERSYDLGNLQSLCTPCHTRKTRLEVGHPPLSEDRQAWRESTLALMRGTNRGKHTGDTNA